jgi:hypothetical protein
MVLIFPVAVSLFLFGSWMVIGYFDTCILKATDLKFDCWASAQIFMVFAGIGAGLAGLMALLARVLLHTFIQSGTSRLEWVSALVSGVLLVLLFYGIIHWQLGTGMELGARLALWLATSFFVCALSLMIVRRFIREAGK